MTYRARRRLGQHFLQPDWVARLIAVIAPGPRDAFLEIGAGRGALTLALAERAAQIAAVEIDRRLAAELEARAPASVTVVHADFMQLELESLELPAPARAAGNLPYGIAAGILLKLLRFSAYGARLADATLMVQREVADRMTAAPGTRDWGPLAIATRMHSSARRVLALPPGAFRPMPRVQSAAVHLQFRAPPVRPADPVLFDALVRAIFTRRRKTALNALRPFATRHGVGAAGDLFAAAGVDPAWRPEQLDLPDLAALSAALAAAQR